MVTELDAKMIEELRFQRLRCHHTTFLGFPGAVSVTEGQHATAAIVSLSLMRRCVVEPDTGGHRLQPVKDPTRATSLRRLCLTKQLPN